MAESGEFPQQFDGSVSAIVDGVQRGDSTERCTELNLYGKGIGDSEVSQLCTVLSHFTALEELWLYRNQITSVGVSELCNVLKLCERLTLLHLGGNSIDDIGAKLIAKTLTDTKMESLYINNNQIGRDGICALLLSAKNSKTLKELHINGNSGVSLALEDIEEILPHYRTLQQLELGFWENDLSEEFRQRIRTVMKRCTKSLKVLLRNGEVPISGSLDFVPALFDSALFHREFLSAVQRCGGISVYRSRVSFVGDSRVGKTWTAKSLRGEPNFHPQTPEECNAQRTAAAESTALQIGDFAFWDVSQMEAIAEVGGTGDEGVGDSEERSPTQSPRENDEQGGNTPAAGQGTEADTEDIVQLHDKVLTAPLPDDIPSDEDARKPVCFLTLWDFGGQKMYHSWYQFFFAPGMIPCVVFDLPAIIERKVRNERRKLPEPPTPVTPPPVPKLTFWQRILPFLRPKSPPVQETIVEEPVPVQQTAESPTPERPPVSTVPQIVDYAQQSLHFGGAGCKVLLIGTQVDCVADSYEERNQVASEAFRRICEESPLQLRNRFLQFPPCGTETNGRSVGVCTVDNSGKEEDVDSGVQVLRNSLIRECMRARPSPFPLKSSQTADGGSTQTEENEQRTTETANTEDPFACFQGNRVPVHWYRFELDLRQSDRWKRVDFCSVKELREYSRNDRFKLRTDVEFVAMLVSMSSAGVFVLGAQVPWVELQVSKKIPKAFLESVVIIRPQWVIEMGRRLLPHPHEDGLQYSQRLTKLLHPNDKLDASIEKLWAVGVVDSKLLRLLLGGTAILGPQTFKAIVQLLEDRLILCRIRSHTEGGEDGQWFVPSMVAFHAEYLKIDQTELPSPSSTHIEFTLDFDWVPPGLPMLFVGAMFRYMKNEPSFSVSDSSEHIQFKVGLSGHAPLVFIDLPNGAGGKTISLWTEIKRPVRPCIENLMHHILDSVHTACQLLYVQPLVENPTQTVERGLLVSFTVPLIRQQLVSKLPSHPLQDVCCRDPEFLPDGCDKDATSRLYQECLSKHHSRYEVRDEWLGSFAPPPKPVSSHRPAADNIPEHRTTGNPAQASSTSAGGGGNVRPARRVRPRMQRRPMRILAS